jgi:hypothetical protein
MPHAKPHEPQMSIPRNWWSPGRVAFWTVMAGMATVFSCLIITAWTVGPGMIDTAITYRQLPDKVDALTASGIEHGKNIGRLQDTGNQTLLTAQEALSVARGTKRDVDMWLRRNGITPTSDNDTESAVILPVAGG